MKRNGRPKESALGYSQKIVAGNDENELERKLRLETATELPDRLGDERKKKNKSGEDGSY